MVPQQVITHIHLHQHGLTVTNDDHLLNLVVNGSQNDVFYIDDV